MNDQEALSLILDLLKRSDGRLFSIPEMSTALRLRGKAKKRVSFWLNRLVGDGRVVAIGRRFGLGTGIHPCIGRRHPRFHEAPQRKSSGEETWRPRGRDRRGPRPPAPADVLKGEIVGTLKAEGNVLIVVPATEKSGRRIRVLEDKGAQLDDRVVVRTLPGVYEEAIPYGEIVEVLGPSGRLSVETAAAIRHYDLPGPFPDTVVREAEDATDLMKDPGPRMDCRNKFILTIDPARARDFDDALSLEQDQEGNHVLGVHIADVSHFVRPGSELDREAERRGNSVYLPDQVIPMLPTVLSNGLCSLRPCEDRLAFSVFLTCHSSGRVLKRRFAKTIIRNHVRLTYEQAMALLPEDEAERKKDSTSDGNTGQHAVGMPSAFRNDSSLADRTRGLLKDLDILAQQVRGRRFHHGALDLNVPEAEVDIDSRGHMKEIRLVYSDRSHQLIEECMILANEAVARELHEKGIRIISRLHEAPAEDKLAKLSHFLRDIGVSPGNLTEPGQLCTLSRSIAHHPLAGYIRTAVLRSMKRAVYSAVAHGHYGLAKRDYAHFTSPIRRYPDLILHRQAASMVREPSVRHEKARKEQAHTKERLSKIALHCSRTEQTAEEAERFVNDQLKFRFLKERLQKDIREQYEAVVVRIMYIGALVEVPALQIQGLVPAMSFSSAHKGQRARFERRGRRFLVGENVFQTGSKIKVVLTRVDDERRQVDFAPA